MQLWWAVFLICGDNLVFFSWHMQYDDLKDCMIDALMNNKPQFVRLFIDHGLNILSYLTYGKLEDLYNSIPDNTQAGKLLQNILKERRNESSHDKKYHISIYEVRSENYWTNIGRLLVYYPSIVTPTGDIGFPLLLASYSFQFCTCILKQSY